MANIVDELISLLGYKIQGEDDLKRYNKSLDALEKKATAVGAAIGKAAGIAGAAAVAGFTLLGKSVLSTAAKFETYAATLETIEGSQEGANKALAWVKNFAKTTPYEVDELTAAFVKLRSYGLDPMDGTMTVLGDTAAGMGKRIDQVVEALADASTFQFERLRELGIVASQAGDQVTFAWTENGKAMTKTVKKTSEEVVKFLNDTWNKKFSGAMIRQSKTWTGMMSNLGDSWTEFQLKIANAGFFDTVKNRLAGVMDQVAAWEADGTLDRIAKKLGSAFTTVADWVGIFAGQIGKHITFISENFETLEPVLTAVGVALGLMVAAAFPIATAFLLAGLAIDDFLSYLEGGDSVIGTFVEAWNNALLNMDAQWQQFVAKVRGGFKGFAQDLASDLRMPDWLRQYLGIAEGESIGRRAETTNQGATVGPDGKRVSNFDNMLQNMDKLNSGTAAAATVNDNKQDNRDQSVHVTAPVTVQVQQATQAPAAVGNAISGAINNAVAQPSRMQGGSIME
ncbi:putative tail protein [Aminobacter phage Erebus]|nr:putative tail protein [Aminobacter phage Erebus]